MFSRFLPFPKEATRYQVRSVFAKNGNFSLINRTNPPPWGVGWHRGLGSRTRRDGRRRTAHGDPGAGTAAPLPPGLRESLERSWRTRPTPAERGSSTCPGAAETLPLHFPDPPAGRAPFPHLPPASLTPGCEGGGGGWPCPALARLLCAERGFDGVPSAVGTNAFSKSCLVLKLYVCVHKDCTNFFMATNFFLQFE